MEILGDLDTYKIVVVMDEATFTIGDIEICSAIEGLNASYEGSERKIVYLETDCDY